MRYEFRYRIKRNHQPFLLSWVNASMDPHASYPAYKVSSIYYEKKQHNPYSFEKINYYEDSVRKRVRLYQNKNGDCQVFAETKKILNSSERVKKRVQLELRDTPDLQEGFQQISCWNGSCVFNRSMLAEFIESAPSLIIQYDRQRFLSKDHSFELCFDQNIKFQTLTKGIGIKGHSWEPQEDDVWEIKTNHLDSIVKVRGMFLFLAWSQVSKYNYSLKALENKWGNHGKYFFS